MRSDCRICHGTNLHKIFALTPTPIGDEYLLEPRFQPVHPIELFQCQDCGLAQLLYEITPEEIYREYLYLTGSSVGLNEHFLEYAKLVIETCKLKAGDMVVDIGSNDGTILAHFKSLGMEVMGVEPAAKLAQISRERGVPTISAYFDKGFTILNSKGNAVKPKVITANNVVANMNNLDVLMEGVMELLADDGTFIFESFYLGDVLKNMVFDFIYHEHLSAFSVKPVKHLMRRYGLSLYRTEHMTTKGGSIRFYCNRYYAGRKPEVEDDDPALYDPQTYVDFAARIEAEKEKTIKYLDWVKSQGKTICGFGASISATTLIYHFGLAKYIDFLVDDNPAKIGRYSPGLHLPVYSSAKATECDYVLVLAWRFVEHFKRAYPKAKLIVPLPHFHVA